MNFKHKWAAIMGAVLVSGGVLTGAAFAATGSTTASGTESSFGDRLTQAVTEGKITQGQADVMKQLGELRKSAMDKVQADSKVIVDEAVAAGKITQEQADQLKDGRGGFRFGGKHGGMKGGKGGRGFGGEFRGPALHDLSAEEAKAKVDAAVAQGKLTQEQADKILEHHAEHAANASSSN